MNMRPIKFRAWDIEKKIMYKEPYLHGPDGTISYVSVGERLPKSDMQVFLMQFTGLLDKNGKEIYEKDIIKTRWKDSKDKKIYIKEVPEMSASYFHWFSELEDMEIEVIGNIHENSDLLK